MVLDGVIAEPQVTWLGLARDKVATFTNSPFCVPPDALPHTTVAGAVRWFPDPVPIGRAADGSCLLLFLVTTRFPTTFRTFLTRHLVLLSALPSQRLRLLIPPALSAPPDVYIRTVRRVLEPVVWNVVDTRLDIVSVTHSYLRLERLVGTARRAFPVAARAEREVGQAPQQVPACLAEVAIDSFGAAPDERDQAVLGALAIFSASSALAAVLSAVPLCATMLWREGALVDIDHQIAHWRDGAREEWDVAAELLQKGRVRHALFFVHLAVEKALKALACRQTKDLAPRTHNLVRLAEVAGLALGHDRLRILARLNEFCQVGRYPEVPGPLPTVEEAEVRVAEVREVFLWLMSE